MRLPVFLNTNLEVQDQDGERLLKVISGGVALGEVVCTMINDDPLGWVNGRATVKPVEIFQNRKRKGNPAFVKGKPNPYKKP